MATDLMDAPTDQTGITTLVSGILSDAQDLVKQQFALMKAEVRADARRVKEAATMFAVGAGAAIVAVLLLMLAVVGALHEAGGLTWWASFLTVGGVMAAVAGVLIYAGIRRWNSFTLVPEQSVAAAKENLRWMANPK